MAKYYLAYGSNLSVAQMAERCRDAIYVGTAEIKDYELLFKGSKTGSYLTIEKKKGSIVPVLVWKISEDDELRLDQYEGCPNFYYKTTIPVSVTSFLGRRRPVSLDGLVYIMHEEREIGCPTERYYNICQEGYRRFRFDEDILATALDRSATKREIRRMEGSGYRWGM